MQTPNTAKQFCFLKNKKGNIMDILENALKNMQESADLEAAIEGKTVDTAAIADSGIILRFTDGTKLTFTCGYGGHCDIILP